MKAKRQKPRTITPKAPKSTNPEFIKEFFTKLGSDLNIAPSNYQKWYDVSPVEVAKRPLGKTILLKNFKMSLASALRSVYPEHPWDEFLFVAPSKTYYRSAHVQRAYFDWLARKLDVKSPLEWYKVDWEAVYARTGPSRSPKLEPALVSA